MKKSTLVLLGMGTSMIMMNGCATIMSGKTQKINLMSEKKQQVKIDGVSYTSPSMINIKRGKEDKVLTVNGCDKKILLKSEMNPAFLGNIIFGGVFGSTTDAATDSMWKYSEDNIAVDCK